MTMRRRGIRGMGFGKGGWRRGKREPIARAAVASLCGGDGDGDGSGGGVSGGHVTREAVIAHVAEVPFFVVRGDDATSRGRRGDVTIADIERGCQSARRRGHARHVMIP